MKTNRVFQERIQKEFVKNLVKQLPIFILKAVKNIVHIGESKAYQLVSEKENVSKSLFGRFRKFLPYVIFYL